MLTLSFESAVEIEFAAVFLLFHKYTAFLFFLYYNVKTGSIYTFFEGNNRMLLNQI